MAILETDDRNIIDAETINWRPIVYPLVGLIVVVVAGLGIYYYQQNQRSQEEAQAREAIVKATTPEALRKVAQQYSSTDQADFALLDAADLSMAKKDYSGASADYRHAAETSNPVLRDSATLGLASSLEAANKLDEAIDAYLTVAHRGKASPYAAFAYTSASRLYEQKKDQTNERKVLTEAASLGVDSPFVKEADYRLKALNVPASTPTSVPVSVVPAIKPPVTNSAPAK